MAQLEYGDYYKFVVSCGIGLIVVSVGLPWLFLHDPFDLLVETSKLANLTPVARGVVLHRQEVVRQMLTLIPYVSAVFGASGIGMTLYGLINWRKRQTLRDAGEEIDVETKRHEFEAMTKEQRLEQAREDVLAQSVEVAASEDPATLSAAAEEYLESEDKFLDALELRLPVGYELLRHQRSMSYKFDAVIRSNEKGAPEYVIALKRVGPTATIRYALDALTQVSFGAAWADFDSKIRHIPMLIAVADAVNAEQMDEISQFIRSTADNPTAHGNSLIRVITPARLTTLSAKDIPLILDTSQRLVVLSDRIDA